MEVIGLCGIAIAVILVYVESTVSKIDMKIKELEEERLKDTKYIISARS